MKKGWYCVEAGISVHGVHYILLLYIFEVYHNFLEIIFALRI